MAAVAAQPIEPVDVVREAWERYRAGDLDGALQYFAPQVVWRTLPGYPGPAVFVGRDDLQRWAHGLSKVFSLYTMTVSEVRDLGEFVLAHGTLYAERDSEVLIDRVALWRCRVVDGLITRVDAQAA